MSAGADARGGERTPMLGCAQGGASPRQRVRDRTGGGEAAFAAPVRSGLMRYASMRTDR